LFIQKYLPKLYSSPLVRNDAGVAYITNVYHYHYLEQHYLSLFFDSNTNPCPALSNRCVDINNWHDRRSKALPELWDSERAIYYQLVHGIQQLQPATFHAESPAGMLPIA
jgi:hypothetical protein